MQMNDIIYCGIALLLTTGFWWRLGRLRVEPGKRFFMAMLCAAGTLTAQKNIPGIGKSAVKMVIENNVTHLELTQGELPEHWTLDPTDTDGDGIPDLWETWTGTDPLVADSHLDLTGDNMSSLVKFWAHLDPRTQSTMGDLPDALKILHQRALLERETFVVEEPDENNDGVIDIWEESGYRYGFIDTTGNGFDDRYEAVMPPLGADNADVELTVTTSRSAVVLWGDESLVLPAGTHTVRIRIPFNEDTDILLEPAPESVEVSGPWKADMTWRWHPSRHPDNTGTRLFEADKTNIFLGGPAEPVQLATILGEPPSATRGMQRMSRQYGDRGTLLPLRRCSINITEQTQSLCVRHGGNSLFHATVQGEDSMFISPQQLRWFAGDAPWKNDPDGVGPTFDAMSKNLSLDHPHTIRCGEHIWHPAGKDTIPFVGRLVYDKATFTLYECLPPVTNILAAASRPDHTPTNTFAYVNYPHCTTTNLNVYLGFDHDKPDVATSNLFLLAWHAQHDSAYALTQHAIRQLIWSQGGSVNLASYLADNALPYMDKLYFTAREHLWNTSEGINPKLKIDNPFEVPNHILQFKKKPREPWSPTIYHIELRYRDQSGVVFDRLWVVINSPDALTKFNEWVADNADFNWTTNLPQVYSKIRYDSNFEAFHPEPNSPVWEKPERKTSLLHHNTGFVRAEMETKQLDGEYSNQAWYDENGNLIETPFFAGRPKKFGRNNPEDRHFINYNKEEIYPFLYAAQLDGNPVHGFFHEEDAPIWQVSYGDFGTFNAMGQKIYVFQNLTRPCIHMGDNTHVYLGKRPPHPTGVLP